MPNEKPTPTPDNEKRSSAESSLANFFDSITRYGECKRDYSSYLDTYQEEIIQGLHRLLENKENDLAPTTAVLIPMHRRDYAFIWLLHQLSKQKGSVTEIEIFINGYPETDKQLPLAVVRDLCEKSGIKLYEDERALGPSGGRSVGISSLPHGDSELLITLDCDTAPFSSRWLNLIKEQFRNNKKLGALYLPHAFPTKSGLLHKAITIPGQILLGLFKNKAHATGPSAVYRLSALKGQVGSQALPESSLRDLVVQQGFSVANIYFPRSWSMTEAERFSIGYLFVVIAQRMPSPISDWANKKYSSFYDQY